MPDLILRSRKSDYVQVLRAIAFIVIFVAHYFTFFTWGAFGVSIFIVLSGYLEAKHHLNDDRLAALKFTKRKIRRIYPLHFTMTLCAIPISALGISNWDQIIKFFAKLGLNLLLIQSWIPIPSFYFSFNAVSWYLTLVIVFALLTPLTMDLLRQLNTQCITVLVIALVVFDFTLGHFSYCLPSTHWFTYVCPITRYADFLIGGGTYKLLNKKAGRGTLTIGAITSVILLILSIGFDDTYEMFSSAAWILPSVFIVSGTCELEDRHNNRNNLLKKALVKIGNISMELFLIHQLVIRYVQLIFKHYNCYSVWLIIPSFVITILAAIIWKKLSSKLLINISHH